VTGKVRVRPGSAPAIIHPDKVWRPCDFTGSAEAEVVYPLVEGLSQRQRQKAGRAALELLSNPPEWLSEALLGKRGWPGWSEALAQLHNPKTDSDLELNTAHRQRLAYDELLAHQLALKILRHRRKVNGRRLMGDGRRVEAMQRGLPFDLTRSQARALEDIKADMAAPERMTRLLMGDVGSGKTVVAALACATAAEAGTQSAIMAPTEVLARQHAKAIEPWCRAAGLTLACLTGRDRGPLRQDILDRVASGHVHVLVGTHALLSDPVGFHDLGLVIVDEQHRFGVAQRAKLHGKGASPDLLTMTATPIPRSLALAAHGDVDVSRLTEKPPGRQPITTRVMSEDRLESVVEALARRIAEGERAYWICPFVEESADGDMRAATARAEALTMALSGRAKVGLVHGRMAAQDKDEALHAFQSGAIDVLVATTVVEVGVDAPDATIIVIEAAERFGLAQLHQLRGRVGRSDKASACLLLYKPPLGEVAAQRLKALRDSQDGFFLAEEDLRLRGGGDPLGLAQTGMAVFRFADLPAHNDLLEIAADEAELIVRADPQLQGRRGLLLRFLMRLFDRQEAAKYLRAA
jgi:ATP-dependent DNA helicase RecG